MFLLGLLILIVTSVIYWVAPEEKLQETMFTRLLIAFGGLGAALVGIAQVVTAMSR